MRSDEVMRPGLRAAAGVQREPEEADRPTTTKTCDGQSLGRRAMIMKKCISCPLSKLGAPNFTILRVD
jgi:hypothetical protein